MALRNDVLFLDLLSQETITKMMEKAFQNALEKFLTTGVSMNVIDHNGKVYARFENDGTKAFIYFLIVDWLTLQDYLKNYCIKHHLFYYQTFKNNHDSYLVLRPLPLIQNEMEKNCFLPDEQSEKLCEDIYKFISYQQALQSDCKNIIINGVKLIVKKLIKNENSHFNVQFIIPEVDNLAHLRLLLLNAFIRHNYIIQSRGCDITQEKNSYWHSFEHNSIYLKLKKY